MGSCLKCWPTRYKALAAVVLFGVGLRLLHLADGAHYPILGADSYYFHYLARQVIAGAQVDPAGSGIVYPVAWLGSVTSLHFAACVIPILIYLLGCWTIYWGAGRLFSPAVALGAVAAYTCMPLSILTTAAGYLDRDGLTVVAMAGAVFGWFAWRRRPLLAIGWIIINIEALTWYWAPMGRWVMISILIVVIGAFSWRSISGGRVRLLAPVGLALAASVGIGLASGGGGAAPEASGTVFDSLSGAQRIVEMSPANPTHLLVFYSFTLISAVVGGIVLINRRRPEDLLAMAWLIGLALAGIAVQRVLILAVPPMAIVAGVGLVYIYNVARQTLQAPPPGARILASVMVVIVLAGVIWPAAGLGAADRMAPGRDWRAALGYLRDNTDPEARVLAHWGYGYWIQDLAGREPVVAGGPQGGWAMEEICRADQDEKVRNVMESCRADYLIVERSRVEGSWPAQLRPDFTAGDIWVLPVPPEQIPDSPEQPREKRLGEPVNDTD